MSAEDRASACGACGGVRLTPFMELKDAEGRPARLVRCRQCRLVQVARLPGDADLQAHYSHYSYDQASAWRIPPATVASLGRLADRLSRYRRTGRLLDIGCGSGALLRVFAGRGWIVEGMEVSEVAVQRLRTEGFTVHQGTVGDLAPRLDPYDVVVMSETIEHVRDPRGLVQAAAGLIRPGGALYLTTPHIDSLSRRLLGARWRPIEVPEHLFYFETTSMRRLLRAAGLRPRALWTDGINPFEILAGLRRKSAPGTGSGTESLREAAVRSPAVGAVKTAVNGGLRLLRLGDTLKVVAEAPP